MENQKASRTNKSESDITSQFSDSSLVKYSSSHVKIKDMIKLIRHFDPSLTKADQAELIGMLDLNMKSKNPLTKVTEKLVQLNKQQTKHTQLLQSLLSLFESPAERANRILQEVRRLTGDALKEDLEWLETSIYENSFDLLNKQLVELSRELELNFTSTQNFVDDFIKIEKVETKSDVDNLRKQLLSTRSTKAGFATSIPSLKGATFSEMLNEVTFLESAVKPDFSIFSVNTKGENILAFAFLELIGDQFSEICDLNTAKNYVYELVKGYEENGNPYHNSTHAADVMMSTFQYGANFGIGNFFFPQEQFALFVGAAIHDFKHPGFNNNYFIRMEEDLALRYNNVAPLENMHLYEAFKLMKSDNEAYDIFSGFSSEMYLYCKDLIIGAVLSTDVRYHNDVIDKAKRAFFLDKEEMKTAKLKQLQSQTTQDIAEQAKSRKEDIGVLVNLMVHCADISNPTKKIDVYRKWIGFVFEEFGNQGRKEIELGLQPSFLCEPNPNIPKSQVGFMNFFVKPTFLTLSGIFPDLTYLVKQIESNSDDFQKEIDSTKQ